MLSFSSVSIVGDDPPPPPTNSIDRPKSIDANPSGPPPHSTSVEGTWSHSTVYMPKRPCGGLRSPNLRQYRKSRQGTNKVNGFIRLRRGT